MRQATAVAVLAMPEMWEVRRRIRISLADRNIAASQAPDKSLVAGRKGATMSAGRLSLSTASWAVPADAPPPARDSISDS